jgi:FkbM family methyltransferase
MNSFLNRAIKAPFALAGLDLRRTPLDPLALLFERFAFRTVLDVGAHEGRFAEEARRLAPNARIVSFEPLPEPFRVLQSRMGSDSHFEAVQSAVGERDGETEIMADDFSPSSSLLPMTSVHRNAFPQTGSGQKLQVPIRSLDTWAKERSLEPPILLKLDVQGYEDRVIRGGRDLLSRATALITEVSFVELYEGQPLFCDLNTLLSDHGFELQGIAEEAREPRTGLALYADAYYVRKGAT